jgi:rhomboid protease GluP
MCPNCRAFITTDDKVCPYCGVQVGARAVDRRSWADTDDRFWTMVLLLINVGLYAATLLQTSRALGSFSMDPSGESLVDFGGLFGPLVVGRGQWWRLITAGFLHGGIFHILMNSYVLWGLGPQVNSAFGLNRYWTIYIASTITGFLASLYWTQALSIGASAGISGLIGAMIALGTRERHSLAGAIRGQYIQWMVIIVAFGFLVPGVDNAAHIGGFVGGFSIAYLAGAPTYRESTETVWKFAALVTLAITLYAFVQMFFWLTRPMSGLRFGALW